jgi:hypothetical protein
MKPRAHWIGITLLAGIVAPACLSRPLERIEPKNTVTISDIRTQSRIDKIDLLLAIDDSSSMSDKQRILAVAVPDLVSGLVNPPCRDAEGAPIATDDPLAECPEGTRREFEPVLDIHIGIISSNLGARGSEWAQSGCVLDDNAQLLSRLPDGGQQATFEDKGFLVWEPTSEAPEAGLYGDAALLNSDLAAMVEGVGQEGCGYEAQLESWYRFLVDPNPYESVAIDPDTNRTVMTGTDTELLAQRKEFLRPDSLVAIVMLTDENDCSYRADSYGYFTTGNTSGRGIMTLKARSECAANPNDPCCAPCGHEPESCPADPLCEDLTQEREQTLTNLTCIDQKRRYGIDLLYPIERYVAGLSQDQIADRDGELHRNPLLVSEDGLHRGTDRVFFAGIVGVPWQLIARDPADLTKGFQNADEREEAGTWGQILGDPKSNVLPADPHMRQSIHPRAGLPGPGSGATEDPYSGHEYEVGMGPNEIGDLQYACVFELNDPITCNPTFTDCDCSPGHSTDNPLCQDPATGEYGNVQYRAKAYPGLRELEVLRDVGDQGIVGSICPAQLDDARRTDRDYGYAPAIQAIIERLKQELGGPCLTRSLTPDTNKQVACIALEGRVTDPGACTCDHAGGRSDVAPEHQPAVTDALDRPTSQEAGLNCFCEIQQLRGDALAECQTSLDATPMLDGERLDGWCYIDATDRHIGNEQLVAHCRDNERRTIRFVGEGEPISGAQLFLTCQE